MVTWGSPGLEVEKIGFHAQILEMSTIEEGTNGFKRQECS